jgi:hypothetical protein
MGISHWPITIPATITAAPKRLSTRTRWLARKVVLRRRAGASDLDLSAVAIRALLSNQSAQLIGGTGQYVYIQYEAVIS